MQRLDGWPTSSGQCGSSGPCASPSAGWQFFLGNVLVDFAADTVLLLVPYLNKMKPEGFQFIASIHLVI